MLAGRARFRAAGLCHRATAPAFRGVQSLAAGQPAEKLPPPIGVRRAREHAVAGWVHPFVLSEKPFVPPQKGRLVGALTGQRVDGSKSKISTKGLKPDASWPVFLRGTLCVPPGAFQAMEVDRADVGIKQETRRCRGRRTSS